MLGFPNGCLACALYAMSEPAPKRRKLNPKPEEEGRRKWLKQLRAMCDRKSTVVVVNGVGNLSGLELLRLFVLDVFSELGTGKKVFPMKKMECRHESDEFRPVDVIACYTSGIKDKGKAQGFVISDLKKKLRHWLNDRTISDNPEADLSDESTEADSVAEDVMSPTLLPPSSWDPEKYPSSQTAGDGVARKSTKGRLVVLTYLHHHAETQVAFRKAFKGLTTSDDALLHLCGCGLGTSEYAGCVTGSHLKLASLDLNREHTHLHFTLRLATSGVGYRQMLEAISGSNDGVYDDVF